MILLIFEEMWALGTREILFPRGIKEIPRRADKSLLAEIAEIMGVLHLCGSV